MISSDNFAYSDTFNNSSLNELLRFYYENLLQRNYFSHKFLSKSNLKISVYKIRLLDNQELLSDDFQSQSRLICKLSLFTVSVSASVANRVNLVQLKMTSKHNLERGLLIHS